MFVKTNSCFARACALRARVINARAYVIGSFSRHAMDAAGLESCTCVLCKQYLVETPRQTPCGERICSPCWRENKERCALINI